MKEKQWVQHISGQGEKWEVVEEGKRIGWMSEGCEPHSSEWCVYAVKDGLKLPAHLLPKSEYRPCDPPEEWEDVTDKLVVTKDGGEASIPSEIVWAIQASNPAHYRLRKVQLFKDGASYNHNTEQWAFIIERRKQR